MHKKPAILLSSYINISTLYNPSPSSTSCRQAPPHTRATSISQTRNYAQHTSGPASQHEDVDLNWPDPIHPHKTPTPYQILSLGKGQPYSKARFYALAKLYHPDQCSHPSSPAFVLPYAVRIERYRLLVAAHTILSDPDKRSAYDQCGHGWAGHKDDLPYASSHTRSWERRREWAPGHDPMNNATWEDWERWYARDEPSREPILSNFGFLSLVFSLAVIGGIGQATRASMYGSGLIERREKIHHEASQGLVQARQASTKPQDRIDSFVRRREAAHTGEVTFQEVSPDDAVRGS